MNFGLTLWQVQLGIELESFGYEKIVSILNKKLPMLLVGGYSFYTAVVDVFSAYSIFIKNFV